MQSRYCTKLIQDITRKEESSNSSLKNVLKTSCKYVLKIRIIAKLLIRYLFKTFFFKNSNPQLKYSVTEHNEKAFFFVTH